MATNAGIDAKAVRALVTQHAHGLGLVRFIEQQQEEVCVVTVMRDLQAACGCRTKAQQQGVNDLMRALAQLGVGTFRRGRDGHLTRFIWGASEDAPHGITPVVLLKLLKK